MAAMIAVPLLLIAIGIKYEMDLWEECRQDHSFWYCARVLGK